MEFLGDVEVYADRKPVGKTRDESFNAKEASLEASVIAVEINSEKRGVTTPTPINRSVLQPSREPAMGVWLGQRYGEIPEVVLNMLSAIGLQKEDCLFWNNHDAHPVQLCQKEPNIRKVLVLASNPLFPKLKPDAPLFHEGVTYLRTWDSQTLEKDVSAKRLLWSLMKTYFLHQK